MKIFLRYFFIISLFFFSSFTLVDAAINFTVTPIRYELDLDPGESVTLPASIKNNGTWSVFLPTSTSDFTSSGDGGTPRFVRKSELVYPDQQLSTWMTLSSTGVTIAPWKETTINFTIDVPVTATPGWHYWAVFFKNPGSESGSGNIGINVDYGILVLVNVSGEIDVWAEIGDPIIRGWATGRNKNKTNTGSSNPDSNTEEENQSTEDNNENAWYIGDDENGEAVYQYPDSCPLWDFTTSKYDNKCFDNILEDQEQVSTSIDGDEPILFSDDFEVDFYFPIKNIWNTHIKPTGKITLTDEDGEVIKAVGKITIENERGAIIWEEIVDYIPINDQWWNILPYTNRTFESVWKGFPYKTRDVEWNQIVNYWTPSEYYTQQNKENAGFLMLWERVSEVRQNKTITADIELVYYDEQWNPITFNTAKEFPVQYIEEKVTLNPYVILALILLWAIFIMTILGFKWFILAGRKHKCWNCNESN